MPVYEATAPDGRVIEFEGDHFPSEQELNEIYGSIGPADNAPVNKPVVYEEQPDVSSSTVQTQTYEATAPDGRTIEFEGDHFPTEQELKEIYNSVAGEKPAYKPKFTSEYSHDISTDTSGYQFPEELKPFAKPLAYSERISNETAEQTKRFWQEEADLWKKGGGSRLWSVARPVFEGLGQLMKPMSVVHAAETAREQGASLPEILKTAHREIMLGDVEKNILPGLQEKGAMGKLTHFAVNMAPYAPSLVVGGGGATARGVGGLLAKSETLAPLGKALMTSGAKIGDVAKAIQRSEDLLMMQPIFSKAAKGIGKYAEAGKDVIGKAAQESPLIKRIVQATISPRLAATKEGVAFATRRAETYNELSGFVQKVIDSPAVRSMYKNVDEAGERLWAFTQMDAKQIAKLHPEERRLAESFFQSNKVIHDKIRQISSELNDFLVASGKTPEEIKAMNLEKLTKDLLDPKKYMHRSYRINPQTNNLDEIQEIIKSAESEITRLAAKDPLQSTSILEDLITTFKNRADDIAKGKRVDDVYKDLERAGVIRGVPADGKAAKGMAKAGVMRGSTSALMKRRLPDEVVEVFQPRKDLKSWFDNRMATIRNISSMDGMLNFIKANPKAAVGTTRKLHDFLSAEMAQTGKTLEDLALLKGLKSSFPDVVVDRKSFDYVKDVLRGYTDADKMVGLQHWAPAVEKVASFWKDTKLRDFPGIIRNYADNVTRFRAYGGNITDFADTASAILRLRHGFNAGLTEDSMKVIYSLIGSRGASLANVVPMEVKKEAVRRYLPKWLAGKGKAITDNQLVHKMGNYWNWLGKQFAVSDEAYRVALLRKKLGTELGREVGLNELGEIAKKSPKLMRVAKDWVMEHSIVYDELPTIAKFIKTAFPFFSYTFRAPRQYVKAFAEHPGLIGVTKGAPQKYSEARIQEEAPEMKGQWLARQNMISNLASPLGVGNVVLGVDKYGDKVEQLRLEPFNIFQSQPTVREYGASIPSQLVDVLTEAAGMGSSGVAPVSPVGMMVSFGAGSSSAEDKTRNRIRTMTPNHLTTLASFLLSTTKGKKAIERSGALKPVLSAQIPIRDANVQRAVARTTGFKVEAQPYSKIMESPDTALNLLRADMQKKAMKDADQLWSRDDTDNWTRAYNKAMKDEMDKYRKAIKRVTATLK